LLWWSLLVLVLLLLLLDRSFVKSGSFTRKAAEPQ